MICIPPERAGRIEGVYLMLSGGGGGCAATFDPEVAWIDDVEIVTDPSCLP